MAKESKAGESTINENRIIESTINEIKEEVREEGAQTITFVRENLGRTVKEYNASYQKQLKDSKAEVLRGFSKIQKNGRGRYLAETDKAATIATCLNKTEQLNEAGAKRLFDSLMLNPETCTDYERNAKARSYDMIFKVLISFAPETLELKKLKEVFDNGKMKERMYCTLAEALSEENFREYEKLVENQSVKTALNKEQLKEVKARWELIRGVAPLFTKLPEIYSVALKYKIDLKEELFGKGSERIVQKGKKQDKGLLNLYRTIDETRESLKKVNFSLKGDMKEALKGIRLNTYKLADNQELLESAKGALRARIEGRKATDDMELYVPTENYQPKEDSGLLSKKLSRLYEKMDFEFEGTGISEKKYQKMKETQRDLFEFQNRYEFNADKELVGQLLKDNSMDARGIHYLLRPVRVNDKGEPLNAEEAKIKEENNQEIRALLTHSLAARKPLLDRAVRDIVQASFTLKQLDDPGYIRKHKDQAMRYLSLNNIFLNLYNDHQEYYQTHEDPQVQAYVYNLVAGTEYINRATLKIHQALLTDGLGMEFARFGHSSNPIIGVLPYRRGWNYKWVMEKNQLIASKDSRRAESYGAYYEGDTSNFEVELDEDTIYQVSEHPLADSGERTDQIQFWELKQHYPKNKRYQADEELACSNELLAEYFAHRNNKEYQRQVQEKLVKVRQFAVDIKKPCQNNKEIVNDL